ncbi:MAG: 23S rRNA (guanosine(2251)-2'-O)-methyltransferase RlmB [Bacteroidales bacterium]|nr:23S rRNA (guanosine(2251)-2'-O)-methyltransferase RlmB [Bacteroidales bacterium]
MEDLIFGIRPIIEFIESGGKPEKVLMQQALHGSNVQTLFSLIRKHKIPYQMVPAARLNKLCKQNHQGVLAFRAIIEYQSLESILPELVNTGEKLLLLVLDGVTDVRNMGAIARSAECAGAHALVIPEKGNAPVNAEAIKASAGALARIPVCRETSVTHAISFLKACGIAVLASDDRAKNTIYGEKLDQHLAVILGSEDKGVSSSARKMADKTVSIPMKGNIASLNVSVAAGVILFEALRQRHFNT